MKSGVLFVVLAAPMLGGCPPLTGSADCASGPTLVGITSGEPLDLGVSATAARLAVVVADAAGVEQGRAEVDLVGAGEAYLLQEALVVDVRNQCDFSGVFTFSLHVEPAPDDGTLEPMTAPFDTDLAGGRAYPYELWHGWPVDAEWGFWAI